MCVTMDERLGICYLYFKGDLTAPTMAEAERTVIDALRRYDAFEVDLSGVGVIDQSGVRLLRWMKNNGSRTIRFVNPSPVALLALESKIDDWS